MSAERLGVQNLKVDGADDTNAKNAVETIKEAIQKVSTQRSALGAVQNRLEHTINNLDNVVENTTSAESQIRDTDMATEMVKYSNNNIRLRQDRLCWHRLTSPIRVYCLCYSNLNHRSVTNRITISCVKTNIKGSAGFLRRDLFALNNLKISVIWPLVKIYKNLFCKNSQFRYLKFWMPIPQKFIGKRPTILYNKYRCCQNGKRFAFRRNGNILRTSSIIGGDTNRKFNERYINDRNESIKKQPPLPRNRSLL